jgi:serine/threonine protein phosphatase PrpC
MTDGPLAPLVLDAAAGSVGGSRGPNEDAGWAGPGLVAVADGVGGNVGGAVAAALAVDALACTLGGQPRDDAEAAIRRAVGAANALLGEAVSRTPALTGMATTLTAATLDRRGRLALAHVGDSRAYRLRDGSLEQLTEDHSLVGGLVRMGKITAAEAEQHPQRSVILRAVGIEPAVEVDVTEHEVEDGDVYLLCSDGLSGMVRDEVIAETLALDGSLAAATNLLIDLANASGGRDNITAVLFRVDAT